jgi:hypothetical protein
VNRGSSCIEDGRKCLSLTDILNVFQDFSFDMSGEQALDLLKSDALAALKQIHGDDLLVLAEGHVGLIKRPNAQGEMTSKQYLEELKGAGALGAVVGSALAVDGPGSLKTYESLQKFNS